METIGIMVVLASPKLVSPDTAEIPEDILRQWREITNLMADLMQVEAGLVMRGNIESMEVMAASEKSETPYKQREKAPRKGQLYCESVIEHQEPLVVEDAFHDPVWQGNPDTELGLASYYGLPVNWPSGTSFGTICVLSVKPRLPSGTDQLLMEKLRDLIELNLALIIAQQSAEFAARHDGLTGLLDRHVFIDEASAILDAWDQNQPAPILLVWDVSRSKEINKQLGLAIVDFVIQEVAERAEMVLSTATHIGRLGGDEFAAVLPGNTDTDIETIISELRDAVQEIQINVEGHENGLHIHTGYAAPERGCTIGEWLDKADQQKYRAKNQGRSRSQPL